MYMDIFLKVVSVVCANVRSLLQCCCISKLNLLRDRAVARVARPPGVEAAGHGSSALELVIFPPGTVVPCCCLSRVVPQRDCNAPVVYGALEVSGDFQKDAVFISVCSCRSACTRVV